MIFYGATIVYSWGETMLDGVISPKEGYSMHWFSSGKRAKDVDIKADDESPELT